MALNFPAKIYQILENESSDTIRWHSNGLAFRIVDHNRFEREIIPKYFRHNQISSVQRQLNLYGFKCISRGEDKGAFFHPKFKRGDWEIVKKITRYTPMKKPNEDGKPESPEMTNQSVENHATATTEQGFQTTQFPPTFQNPIHPPVVQTYRHFDPFSYIEANGFPVNGDPVFNSHWQHWAHVPAPFMTSPYGPLPVNSLPESKPVDSSNKSVNSNSSSSAMSVESTPSVPEEKKFEKTLKLADPTKSFVHVVNDVVTIDPDFDLDGEFDLFHEMDHQTNMMHDFETLPVSISAPVEHPESKTRDFGVNTDLTQNESLEEVYTSCHIEVSTSSI